MRRFWHRHRWRVDRSHTAQQIDPPNATVWTLRVCTRCGKREYAA